MQQRLNKAESVHKEKRKKSPSQLPLGAGGWTLQRMASSSGQPNPGNKLAPRIQRTLVVENKDAIPSHLASGTITDADRGLVPSNLVNQSGLFKTRGCNLKFRSFRMRFIMKAAYYP